MSNNRLVSSFDRIDGNVAEKLHSFRPLKQATYPNSLAIPLALDNTSRLPTTFPIPHLPRGLHRGTALISASTLGLPRLWPTHQAISAGLVFDPVVECQSPSCLSMRMRKPFLRTTIIRTCRLISMIPLEERRSHLIREQFPVDSPQACVLRFMPSQPPNPLCSSPSLVMT